MNSFSQRCAVLTLLLLSSGCYRPYQNHGWQGQPGGYYPAQPGQFQNPGQLYIPQSNAPLSAPGTATDSYNDNPPGRDDFGPDGQSFFPEDAGGGVPPPRGSSGGGSFENDFPGS